MTVNPTDDADLDKATIYHLNRIGWSLAQIADVVDVDPDTVMRVIREAPDGLDSAVAAAPPLAIRLTKDARRLRIVLPSDALREPTEVVLARIKEHCARHTSILPLPWKIWRSDYGHASMVRGSRSAKPLPPRLPSTSGCASWCR